MKSSDMDFAVVNQHKRYVLEAALELIIATEQKIKLSIAYNKKALSEEYQTWKNYAEINRLESALQEFKEWVRLGNKPKGSTEIYEQASVLEKLMGSSLIKHRQNAYNVAKNARPSQDTIQLFRWIYATIELTAFLSLAASVAYLSSGFIVATSLLFVLLQVTMGIPVLLDELSNDSFNYTKKWAKADFSLDDDESIEGVMPESIIDNIINASDVSSTDELTLLDESASLIGKIALSKSRSSIFRSVDSLEAIGQNEVSIIQDYKCSTP